jgi:hypothetical protein
MLIPRYIYQLEGMPEVKIAVGTSKAEVRKVRRPVSGDFNLLEASFYPFEAWFDLAGTRATRRDHPKKSTR